MRESLTKLFEQAGKELQRIYGDIPTNKLIDYLLSNGVAVVKHGRWVEYPRAHYFKCSECKYTVLYRKAYSYNGERAYEYCPHCGARMDGDSNENNLRTRRYCDKS